MMKQIILAILLLCPLVAIAQVDDFSDTKKVRQQQIDNINNRELWNMERLKDDIVPPFDLLPLKIGAYPVPYYDSLGPFNGCGVMGNLYARSKAEHQLRVKDQEVVFTSFFIGDSPFYEKENSNRVFFTIISVVDSVDANQVVPGMNLISSRNHPDYGGEGSIITKNNRIEYVAFTTPDKGSFAIVNMRLGT